MKFLPDAPHGHTITACGPGWISVNGQRHEGPVLVHAVRGVSAWDCPTFEALQAAHFEPLAALQPELILFGSGDKLRFARPEWLQSLYALRIGVESMDTAAACRTYNFLSGEGRKVLAALLL